MVSKTYNKYCDWVSRHPVEASEYESMFKWTSLLLAGRSDSLVVPEALYAVSNLITLHNDVILLKKYNLLIDGIKMKVCLSVLEYCEVFVEMGVSHLGRIKKWTLITIIQLIKCAARLHLLKYSHEGIIGNPPLSPIERFTFRKTYLPNSTETNYATSDNSEYLLRIISEIPKKRNKRAKITMTKRKLCAEILFTVKPISHLGVTFLLGKSSWKPFILSFIMDAISLVLHMEEHRLQKLTTEEEIVLTQRYFKLFLYFLRSPLYDKHFKAIMLLAFEKLYQMIPFTQTILKPLLLYLIKPILKMYMEGEKWKNVVINDHRINRTMYIKKSED